MRSSRPIYQWLKLPERQGSSVVHPMHRYIVPPPIAHERHLVISYSEEYDGC